MATASPPTGYRTSPANGTTPTDVDQQLQTIRNEITQLTKQMSELVDQTKDTAMSQVKTQVRRAQEAANSAMSDAQATGKEAVDAFRDVADTFGDAIDDSLKRRPYATLAVAAGIGFLFGAAWKR
jgi:ElaB/YqjD/DUF883 family membrane-anchored ribosome-binding protein